jgi:hypothetical protein
VSARSSLGEGGGVCQVVSCPWEASRLPVQVTLACGLMLELVACPSHVDALLDELDGLIEVGQEPVE